MNLKRLLKICLIKFPPARSLALLFTRRVPRILMYHRFVDSHEGRLRGVSADSFTAQIGLLKDRFEVVSLSELFDKCRRGEAPDYTAVITVDDAYMDFYRIAYPILRRQNVPATLFAATDFIGPGKWFWWDKLSYTLSGKGACIKSFSFDGVDFLIDLSTAQEAKMTWHRLADFCLRSTERAREDLMEGFASAMKVEVPHYPAEEYRQMDWPQIIEISGNMIEVGSHTLSHPILTTLGEKDLRREVEHSKEVIESNFTEIKKYRPKLELPAQLYRPVGCEKCTFTGYKGRISIYEGILMDRAIEAILRENPSEREIKEAAKPQGILDMRQDGIIKVLGGITSLDEIERAVGLEENR